jgi:hypothetical protein
MLKIYVGLLAGLLAAGPAQAQVAVASKLAPGVVMQAPAVRVLVADAVAFRRWAAQALPGAQLAVVPGSSVMLTVKLLTNKQLAVLAAAPLVEFVDLPDRPAYDERLLNSADLTVNSLRAVQRRYPALTG